MNKLAIYAALPLRLAVGGVFLRHGIAKWQSGVTGVAGFLHGLGFPFASLWAVLLIAVETIGAACVVAGVFTRAWASCMAVVMIVAILRVKVPGGGAFELEALLLAGATSLVALGAGPFALGVKFKKPD